MIKKELLTRILLLMIFLTLISCEQNIKKRMNCICLIDFSGSLSEKTLNDYIHTISYDLLRNMDQYDRLIVLPIDEGAKIEAVKLINEDFTEKKFSFQSDGFTHAQDSIIKRINIYVQNEAPRISETLKRQKELRKKFTTRTDIISALKQAKNLMEENNEDSFLKQVGRFASGKNKMVTENIIVLFSDMINESYDCSFEHMEKFSGKDVAMLINKLEGNNKVPDLKNTKVFVCGRTGRNNAQIETIENFWRQFFNISGATLVAYDYDVGDEITKYLIKKRED